MRPEESQMMRMISAGASRIELVRHFGSLTPERVLQQGYTTLASLKRDNSIEDVERALAIMLIDTSRSFGDPLDKDTALEIAAEIHTRYYYMALEECYIVLGRMKSKTMYGKVTANNYLAEMSQYDKERLKMADEMSYNQHLATSDAGTNRGCNTATIKEIMKPLKKRQ